MKALAFVVVHFVALMTAVAADSGEVLRIHFAVSKGETGKQCRAPDIVVRNGESARLQFLAEDVPVDVTFSPSIKGDNVFVGLVSHPKDQSGNARRSQLCGGVLTPFDSEVGMEEGAVWFHMIVSRAPVIDNGEKPNNSPDRMPGTTPSGASGRH